MCAALNLSRPPFVRRSESFEKSFVICWFQNMSEARLNYWLEKVGSKGHWESHSSLSSVPIRLGQVVLSPSRFRCIYCLLPLACSAGVFFERAICSRKHYVEASRRERRWGESKGVGREKRKRCTFFLPSPLSFFRPRTYRKGYHFYSPQSSTVIKSMMVATTILRTRTRFRPPKIRLHCRLRFHLFCLPIIHHQVSR